MSTTPQFTTAQYNTSSGGDVCRACKQPISGTYYRVNGAQACETCVRKIQDSSPKDSHSAFVRGILFGIGGAILGLLLYSAFAIITGLVIGYVALAVGWIVAKAIKMGSKGIGGRRYQIAAVALTYGAVSLSAIPIGISQYAKDKESRPSATQSQSAEPSDLALDDPASSSAAPNSVHQAGLGSLLGSLLFAGLASPFLELGQGFSGIIGLVILLVGIQIAWKMTAAPVLDIVGPFQASPPAPAAG